MGRALERGRIAPFHGLAQGSQALRGVGQEQLDELGEQVGVVLAAELAQ